MVEGQSLSMEESKTPATMTMQSTQDTPNTRAAAYAALSGFASKRATHVTLLSLVQEPCPLHVGESNHKISFLEDCCYDDAAPVIFSTYSANRRSRRK